MDRAEARQMIAATNHDLKTQTIDDVLDRLIRPDVERLPAPHYQSNDGTACLGLAVESMKRHMTAEGWELFQGLESAGCVLAGKNLTIDCQDVPMILDAMHHLRFSRGELGTVIVQDKREWEGLTAGGNGDPEERFLNVQAIRHRDDLFKLTVLKDAQSAPNYHRQSADEMGAHAWIVYYHPRIVAHLAPYVRQQHLVRTWHSLNKDVVPAFNADRQGTCLSGAISGAYPLRRRINHKSVEMGVKVLHHPGYHRKGCQTPEYLKQLSRFKVSICTSSMYGYALRKIVESVACGCTLVTDLPVDDVLLDIDDALVRVHPLIAMREMTKLLRRLESEWNADEREHFAGKAKDWYDFRAMGQRLAADIQTMREEMKPST